MDVGKASCFDISCPKRRDGWADVWGYGCTNCTYSSIFYVQIRSRVCNIDTRTQVWEYLGWLRQCPSRDSHGSHCWHCWHCSHCLETTCSIYKIGHRITLLPYYHSQSEGGGLFQVELKVLAIEYLQLETNKHGMVWPRQCTQLPETPKG
jgi:hypothetical protein